MVDQAAIQGHVAYGYGKAAAKLGATIQQIRPTTALLPLQQPPHATPIAFFDQDAAFGMAKPWSRRTGGGADGFAALDTADVLPGDLLIGADIYFVTRFEPVRPLQVVLTNVLFDILEDAEEAAPGPRGRGGRVLGGVNANVEPIATGWPAWKSVGGRAETDPTRLPGDVRAPSWSVLLPPIPGVTLTRQMILREPSGLTLTISAAVLSEFGWQLIAGENDL